MTAKTQTKHTPGPWKRGSGTFIQASPTVSIARVLTGWGVKPGPEAVANADLIAAAPELYETAKAYLEVIQGDDSPEAIALRAAIAKAEGAQ